MQLLLLLVCERATQGSVLNLKEANTRKAGRVIKGSHGGVLPAAGGEAPHGSEMLDRGKLMNGGKLGSLLLRIVVEGGKTCQCRQ